MVWKMFAVNILKQLNPHKTTVNNPELHESLNYGSRQTIILVNEDTVMYEVQLLEDV